MAEKKVAVLYSLTNCWSLTTTALLNFFQLAATFSTFDGFYIGIPLGEETICCIFALLTNAALAVLVVVAVVPSLSDILWLRGHFLSDIMFQSFIDPLTVVTN